MNYLEAEDLTTGYGRQVISEALNCSFEAGTITSIIGPNGCGKSTLLKTLARILPAEKGKVFIKNQELQHFSSKEVAQELAILSQTPENTIDLSVFDLVSFGLVFVMTEKVQEYFCFIVVCISNCLGCLIKSCDERSGCSLFTPV